MRLIVDLDGTVFPTYDSIARLHLQKTGEPLDWTQICEDNTHPFWKTPSGKWTRGQFTNHQLYANLKAYSCVNDILRLAIHLEWQLAYITARYPTMSHETYYSLGNNHLPFAPVIFVERELAPQRKAQLARNYHADLCIDDELYVLQELEKSHIPFIKIPQVYNIKNWKSAMISNAWHQVELIVKGDK